VFYWASFFFFSCAAPGTGGNALFGEKSRSNQPQYSYGMGKDVMLIVNTPVQVCIGLQTFPGRRRGLTGHVFSTTGWHVDVSLRPEANCVCLEQVDVSHIFPNGAVSIRVICIPGTSVRLRYDLRIIISSDVFVAP
jgi:hypothetical protein